MNDEIIISANKKKMILLLFVGFAFVVFGLIMLFKADTLNTKYNPVTIRIFGGFATLFFGLLFMISLKKIISPKPALQINSKGIMDNSSGTSIGFVPWKDILGFKLITISSNKLLVVKVKNPTIYIEKGTNIVMRQSLKYSYKTHGSPVVISVSLLSLKAEKVEQLVVENFNRYLT